MHNGQSPPALTPARGRLRDSALRIRNLVRSTRGPGGSTKILQARPGAGAITVTACADRIFSLFANTLRDEPIGRTLVLLSQTQSRTWGDGGLLAALVASELVLSGLDEPFLSAPLMGLGRWCCEILMDPTCHVSSKIAPSDLQTLLKIIRSVLAPKAASCRLSGAAGDETHLAIQILRAFLSTASALQPFVHQQAAVPGSVDLVDSFVRILPVSGLPVGRSVCIEDTVVIDLPWPWPLRCGSGQVDEDQDQEGGDTIANVKVALFNAPIELSMSHSSSVTMKTQRQREKEKHAAPVRLRVSSGTGTGTGTGTDTGTDTGTSNVVETDHALDFCASLMALGVGMLASQKTIDGHITDVLSKHGILVFPRLSIRHLDAVRRVSGASVLSSMGVPVQGSDLGCVDVSRMRMSMGVQSNINMNLGSDFVAFKRSIVIDHTDGNAGADAGADAVSTLVLCGPDSHAVDELEHVTRCALKVLKHAILGQNPRVCVGAGCTEMYLAKRLRERGCSASGSAVAVAATRLADALEKAAGALAHTSTISEAINELRQSQMQADIEAEAEAEAGARTQFGWDGAGRVAAVQSTVVDLADAKLGAVTAALEAACAILRVSNVVYDSNC